MNQNFQNLIIVGNSNRFATNHHEDIQLVNILHSEDFFFEISSPLRISHKKKSSNGNLKAKKKPNIKISKHKRSETEIKGHMNFQNSLVFLHNFIKIQLYNLY